MSKLIYKIRPIPNLRPLLKESIRCVDQLSYPINNINIVVCCNRNVYDNGIRLSRSHLTQLNKYDIAKLTILFCVRINYWKDPWHV